MDIFSGAGGVQASPVFVSGGNCVVHPVDLSGFPLTDLFRRPAQAARWQRDRARKIVSAFKPPINGVSTGAVAGSNLINGEGGIERFGRCGHCGTPVGARSAVDRRAGPDGLSAYRHRLLALTSIW
mgnify:CR=1 FL=1